jgi:acyl-CoA thioester hydrolase
LRHLYRCPLRWSDMDAFGHVNNVVFLRYLEEARVDLMFRLAREAQPGAFEGGSVVARHEIDYLRPLKHRPEPVTVQTWVTKTGSAHTTLAYEITDGEESGAAVYVRAQTLIVPYDLVRERPRRLTPGEKSFLEVYTDDSAAPSRPGLR